MTVLRSIRAIAGRYLPTRMDSRLSKRSREIFEVYSRLSDHTDLGMYQTTFGAMYY